MTARDWVDRIGQVDTDAVLADTRRVEQLRQAVVDAARRYTAQFERAVTGLPRRDALKAAVDAYETALREVTG
jgi:hypothetical protein